MEGLGRAGSEEEGQKNGKCLVFLKGDWCEKSDLNFAGRGGKLTIIRSLGKMPLNEGNPATCLHQPLWHSTLIIPRFFLPLNHAALLVSLWDGRNALNTDIFVFQHLAFQLCAQLKSQAEQMWNLYFLGNIPQQPTAKIVVHGLLSIK